MAVSPADFRIALGQFFSLEAYGTDQDNFITAIVVNIEGIVGCKSKFRRNSRMTYRLLASVDGLGASLPDTWIVSPDDSRIEHLNIWRADRVCPITGAKLPRICWGSSGGAGGGVPAEERTLAHFLEVARQVLSHANAYSPAR
jgi:hypothetical protein